MSSLMKAARNSASIRSARSGLSFATSLYCQHHYTSTPFATSVSRRLWGASSCRPSPWLVLFNSLQRESVHCWRSCLEPERVHHLSRSLYYPQSEGVFVEVQCSSSMAPALVMCNSILNVVCHSKIRVPNAPSLYPSSSQPKSNSIVS